MLPTIQGFVEDEMYISKGNIPMSTEGILIVSGYVSVTSAYLKTVNWKLAGSI